MTATRTVADVMNDDIHAFAQDTSIEAAARFMVKEHITGAPVLSRSGRPVGVISIGDLIDMERPRSARVSYPLFYRVADDDIEELDDSVVVSEGQVADVMSPFVLSIESSATLTEAAGRMLGEEVHRLLVMDGTRLVGIVTVLDLLRGFVTSRA